MSLRATFFVSILAVLLALLFVGIAIGFRPALIYAAVIIAALWMALVREIIIGYGIIIIMLIPVAFFSVGMLALSQVDIWSIRAFTTFAAAASVTGLITTSLMIRSLARAT